MTAPLMRMSAYTALDNNTEIACLVVRIVGVAGETDCFECGGFGQWPWHPDDKMRQCIDCKGLAGFM